MFDKIVNVRQQQGLIFERHVYLVYGKIWTTSSHAVTVVIRAALVSEETGSAFHPPGGVL